MISEINNLQEFENLIQNSNEIYILDFYADWCGPCQMMMPIFESVSKIREFAKLENLKFTKISKKTFKLLLFYDLIKQQTFNLFYKCPNITLILQTLSNKRAYLGINGKKSVKTFFCKLIFGFFISI